MKLGARYVVVTDADGYCELFLSFFSSIGGDKFHLGQFSQTKVLLTRTVGSRFSTNWRRKWPEPETSARYPAVLSNVIFNELFFFLHSKSMETKILSLFIPLHTSPSLPIERKRGHYHPTSFSYTMTSVTVRHRYLSAFVVWSCRDHSHCACPNSESIVSLNSELSVASFCSGRFPHVFMKKTSAVRARILAPDFCFSITFMSARSFSWHTNYFSFLTSLFGGSASEKRI